MSFRCEWDSRPEWIRAWVASDVCREVEGAIGPSILEW